jgi:hypothetical protein
MEAMSSRPKVSGVRDGQEITLPAGLDALVIEAPGGGGAIYIDLGGQVPGMVLMRASIGDHERTGPTRLIMSPMESGRIAVGVIRSH